jgi:ABC-type multidrug transport system ATPase subunit
MSGVLIQSEGLTVRDGDVDVQTLTVSLGAGVHAFLGRKEDGAGAALAGLAGILPARRGRVLIHGKNPRDVRQRVAYVGLEVTLPDALRVREVLEVAAALRGEPARDPKTILGALRLEGLAERPVKTLSAAEARSVAVAEALASTIVDVILLEEPFFRFDAGAAATLLPALRAKKGCVVVATPSTRDASLVADDYVLFDRGRPLQVSSIAEARGRFGAGKVRYRVIASDARSLLARLAEEEVERIALDGDAIIVEGDHVESLAKALGRAIVKSGVDVRHMAPDVPPLDELRANVAGHLAGVYSAAAARAAAPAPTATPTAAPITDLPTPPPRLGGPP